MDNRANKEDKENTEEEKMAMARKTVQCWHVLAQWMEWVLVFAGAI